MPFPLFSNPFHSRNNTTHEPTSSEPKNSSEPNRSTILRPIVNSARNRTQSLATAHHPTSRPKTAQETQLIKKIKSYGAPEKTRPPPLKLASPLRPPQKASSRPTVPRRASSLDSITAGFQLPPPPPPHSPHQQYLQNAGFLQTPRTLSGWSSGPAFSESSEELLARPSSRPSTAGTTPLSSAGALRSRFSPRDTRPLFAPHQALKPRLLLAASASRTSLSPPKPAQPPPASPSKLLDPLEIVSSVARPAPAAAPASWTLDVSGAPSCVLADLPGPILRLTHAPKHPASPAWLEPHLQKIVTTAADGAERVEWELRLAPPAVSPAASPCSSPQSSTVAAPAPGHALTAPSPPRALAKPAPSVVMLNLNTFRASAWPDAGPRRSPPPRAAPLAALFGPTRLNTVVARPLPVHPPSTGPRPGTPLGRPSSQEDTGLRSRPPLARGPSAASSASSRLEKSYWSETDTATGSSIGGGLPFSDLAASPLAGPGPNPAPEL
ncbi:hypothetical protein PtB15_11B378 [Puccinia triticina]|nr:hypothetical protein PtB15_11B378 [Puccinia triticina]